MKVVARNCLDPLHPIVPTFKVEIEFPVPVKIELAESFYVGKALLELEEHLMVQLAKHDYNLVAYILGKKMQKNSSDIFDELDLSDEDGNET